MALNPLFRFFLCLCSLPCFVARFYVCVAPFILCSCLFQADEEPSDGEEAAGGGYPPHVQQAFDQILALIQNPLAAKDVVFLGHLMDQVRGAGAGCFVDVLVHTTLRTTAPAAVGPQVSLGLQQTLAKHKKYK